MERHHEASSGHSKIQGVTEMVKIILGFVAFLILIVLFIVGLVVL